MLGTLRKAARGCVLLILGGTGFFFAYVFLTLLLIKFQASRICGVDVTEPFWEIGASHKYCHNVLTIMARPLGIERHVHACIYDCRVRKVFQRRALENPPDDHSQQATCVLLNFSDADIWK